MPYPKGKPKPANSGRKKGTPNKVPATLKEDILIVYAGLGGPDAMLVWARNNQTEFYAKILPKLLPKDVTVDVGGTVRLRVEEIVEDAPASQEESPPA